MPGVVLVYLHSYSLWKIWVTLFQIPGYFSLIQGSSRLLPLTMSMLDSLFKQGFKASKCKTLLKLTIPRIKLLRNRRDMQLKQMRREIAKLLETGQEATARIRVEHIIREENMMAAQEILELFCELIVVRLPIIESQRECPLDLKEAISSICFAAPRCADLPELLQVQLLFASKYGKEFLTAATELMPNCGVNRQLIELLSVRAPLPDKKLKLLKEIAEEHGVEWDPSASETEFFKPHEDLLNGPTEFVGGLELPLPKEKHDEPPIPAPGLLHIEQADSDSELDDFVLPDVPKVSVRATANVTSEPPGATPQPETIGKPSVSSAVVADLKQQPYGEDGKVTQRRVADDQDGTHASFGPAENKQFLPFVSPPASVATSSLSSVQASVAASSPSLPIAASPTASEKSPHTLSSNESETGVDLQDVLAAAQAAAETAERAAAAARSAATLAHARISELTKYSRHNVRDDSYDNPFHVSTSDQSETKQDYGSSDMDSALPYNHLSGETTGTPTRQPHRLPSMDDETFFSYTNLLSSQKSINGSNSSSGNTR